MPDPNTDATLFGLEQDTIVDGGGVVFATDVVINPLADPTDSFSVADTTTNPAFLAGEIAETLCNTFEGTGGIRVVIIRGNTGQLTLIDEFEDGIVGVIGGVVVCGDSGLHLNN